MLFKLLFVLMALNGLTTIEAGNRRYKLQVNSLNCSATSARAKLFECDLKKVATSRYAVDVNGLFDRQVAEDAEVRVLIHYRLPPAGRVVKFLDLKIKICDALTQAMNMPLVNGIMKEARRTGNLPYSCPLKGNFLYKLENYSLTEETIPAYAPFVNFNFSFNLYEGQKKFASMLLVGATVPRT